MKDLLLFGQFGQQPAVQSNPTPALTGTKEGGFITKDGRVIFIGGPGSGGGTAGGSDSSFVQKRLENASRALALTRDDIDDIEAGLKIIRQVYERINSGESFSAKDLGKIYDNFRSISGHAQTAYQRLDRLSSAMEDAEFGL